MKNTVLGLLCLAVTGLFLVTGASALAEEGVMETEISIGLGGAVSTSLYRNYNTQWNPLPIIGFENDWGYIRGLNAGLKIVNLRFLELSVFAGYDPTSFDSSDTSHDRLRKLNNRHPSALIGTEVRLLTPYGLFLARGSADILDNSGGFTGEIGYKHSLEVGPLEFIPAAGLYWASSGYNNYYYGISSKEARKSGFERYRAGSSFSPYLGLIVDWEIDEHWDIFCHGEIVFPGNEIKSSPMVGRSNSKQLTFGLMYYF